MGLYFAPRMLVGMMRSRLNSEGFTCFCVTSEPIPMPMPLLLLIVVDGKVPSRLLLDFFCFPFIC